MWISEYIEAESRAGGQGDVGSASERQPLPSRNSDWVTGLRSTLRCCAPLDAMNEFSVDSRTLQTLTRFLMDPTGHQHAASAKADRSPVAVRDGKRLALRGRPDRPAAGPALVLRIFADPHQR